MSDERGADQVGAGISGEPPTGRPDRRRRIGAGVAAAAALVMLVGAVFWYVARPDGPERRPSTSTGEPTGARNPGLVWWMAQVHRPSSLTVYVSRPVDGPPCEGAWVPRATVAVGTATVTVTVSDTSATGNGCASSDKLAAIRVDLPEPLAGRQLLDGYDDGRRPTYHEKDLPTVPGGADGWSKVRTSYSAPRRADLGPPGVWGQSYTRPGGPDIWIRGYPPDHVLAAVPWTRPVGTVEVVGNLGTIYPAPGDVFLLRWEASGMVYCLMVVPREGATVSLPEIRDVLARIGVS